MRWNLLLGVAVLTGLGSAATEYDNVPLETSPSEYSRRSPPRPIYTASYGVAPGEYVLRGSDNSNNSPSPIQGLGFLPREQAPPQEYLDLLRQTGASDDTTQGKQSTGTSRVIDQQYFGIQPNAPYPASGPSPVPSSGPIQQSAPYPASGHSPVPSSGPSLDRESNVPSPPYPLSRQNQVPVLNIATNSRYPSVGAGSIPLQGVSPKPNSVSNNRKIVPSGPSSTQGVSRQGSGKAVQLAYSLDYDLATLHRNGEAVGRNADSSSSSAPYYTSGPGTTVRGNEELLNQLAPKPQPIPFLPSFDSSQDRKKTRTKTSGSSDIENEKDKVEVIKLPSPKGQRPITQEELMELIRAGYDVTPVEDSVGQRRPTTQQQPQSGYQRAIVPQNQLLLPKSRGISTSPQSTGYFRTSKTQDTASPQQTYLSGPGTAPSAGGTDSAYYQTSSPVPIPLIRQQSLQPQVQTYQPGTSGIQQVEQPHQTYQKETEAQTHTHQTPISYVSQGFPSAPAQQQQVYQPLGEQQGYNYPTAAAQQQQEYHQVSGQQAHLYQQSANPHVQVYQPTTASQSRNEALSQPKEYIIPAPSRPKSFGSRVAQTYHPTSPSASGNEDSLTYQQALGPIPQGYGAVSTAPGATAHGATAPDASAPDASAPGATAPGGDIQRTQPRSRNSRRRQYSHRESPITYIQRYQGDSTGYSTEQ